MSAKVRKLTVSFHVQPADKLETTDAATFKQSDGISYVNGGGCRSAADKVFQHNGFGTLKIKNFFADTFGKLYRSCGNCSGNGKPRHVTMDNIYAINPGTPGLLIGINANYGDTAVVSNSCGVKMEKACALYEGCNNSCESPLISSGPDAGGYHCVAENIQETCYQ